MRQIRLTVIAGAASILGLAVAFAGPAASAVGQQAIPRASGPFKIGPSSSAGTVVLSPTGERVAVFDVSSGRGKARVCLISPTGRKCASSVLLSPPTSSDDTFGTPGVFIPAKNHVVVLQNTCCDSNPDSTVLYTSTDGGKTFRAPVRVGELGVDVSELIGSQILFSEENSSFGLQVVSVPVTATSPAATATISTRDAFDVGLGQYKGGALVGTDFSGKSTTTYLYYAPKGKNFDEASSYRSVGKINGEAVLGMSGSALVTYVVKTGAVRLRMFGGSGFGPARTVPHVKGGIGTWDTVDQDPSGHVHVFAILATAGYEMFEVSTSNGGKTWSSAAKLGDGINSDFLSAAVNSKGKGFVLGNSPAWGYPVP